MRTVNRMITKDSNIGISKVRAMTENKFDSEFSRGGLFKAMKKPNEKGEFLQGFRQSRGGALSEEHRLHRLSGIKPCLKRNPIPKNVMTSMRLRHIW